MSTFKTNAAGLAKLKNDQFRRMVKKAEWLAQKVRDNIDTPGPPHSSPGEYPHMVSGALHGSVRVVTDKGSMTAQVVATAEHAEHIEKIRPFLSRTLEEFAEQVTQFGVEV